MSLGRLNKEEREVLNFALEHYIRLGLGQLSDIAARLNVLLINKKDQEAFNLVCALMEEAENKLGTRRLEDPSVSRYTLIALLIQARLNDDTQAVEWVKERLKTCKDQPQK